MRKRALVALTIVASSAAGIASATTMRALSVAALSEQADLVVRGHVVSTSDVLTVVDGELAPRLVTRVLPDEILAGSAPEGELSVVERGGTEGGLVFMREGIPELRRGQEVLLFLVRTSEGYRAVGHAQGAFVVGRNREGEARVRRGGDPGILLGSTVDKNLDLSANPRLEDVEAIVHELRGASR